MGSYGVEGTEWMAHDVAVDGARRKHPTGQGAGRVIGQAVDSGNVATWTLSTLRVTKAGFFTGYVRVAGDVFVVTGGTGWVLGSYLIASSANNFLTLTAAAGQPTANNADTTGYIIPLGSILGASKGARVQRLIVTAADAADQVIEIRSQVDSTLWYSLPVPLGISVPFPVRLNLNLPGGFTAGPALGSGATTLAFIMSVERVQ